MDELIHSLDFRYSPANDLLRLYIYVIRGDGRSRQPQFSGAFENLSENYNRAFVSIPGSEPTGYFTADYGKYADSICWLNLRKRELTESLSHPGGIGDSLYKLSDLGSFGSRVHLGSFLQQVFIALFVWH